MTAPALPLQISTSVATMVGEEGRRIPLPSVRPKSRKEGAAWDAARKVADWAERGRPEHFQGDEVLQKVNERMPIGPDGKRIKASLTTVRRALGMEKKRRKMKRRKTPTQAGGSP